MNFTVQILSEASTFLMTTLVCSCGGGGGVRMGGEGRGGEGREEKRREEKRREEKRREEKKKKKKKKKKKQTSISPLSHNSNILRPKIIIKIICTRRKIFCQNIFLNCSILPLNFDFCFGHSDPCA